MATLTMSFTDTVNMNDWLWKWQKVTQMLFSKVTNLAGSWSEDAGGNNTWVEEAPDILVIESGWS